MADGLPPDGRRRPGGARRRGAAPSRRGRRRLTCWTDSWCGPRWTRPTQPFLDDHRIDGTAVLPGVMGMEVFAEVGPAAGAGVVRRRGRGRRLPGAGEVLPGRAADADGHRADPARRRGPGRRVPARGGAAAAGQRRRRSGPCTSPARCASRPAQAARRPGDAGRARAGGRRRDRAADVYRLYFHGPAYQVVGEAWRGRRRGRRPARRAPADRPATRPRTPTAPRPATGGAVLPGRRPLGGRARGPARPAGPRRPAERARRRSSTAETGAARWRSPGRRRARHGVFDCQVLDPDGRVLLRLDGYRTVPMPGPLPEDVRAPLRARAWRDGSEADREGDPPTRDRQPW